MNKKIEIKNILNYIKLIITPNIIAFILDEKNNFKYSNHW